MDGSVLGHNHFSGLDDLESPLWYLELGFLELIFFSKKLIP